MKHYSLFSLSLFKNEERFELTFLDSLKFNREGKEEVFFWFSVSGSISSLNKALSIFFDTHASVLTFSSAITSSFLLLLLSVLPGESDHVSYMTDKSSCFICKVKKPPWVISGSCSLFKDLTQCLIYILIPSLLYLLSLVSPFLYPIPSHSCDPLEDLFIPYHSMVLHQHFLMTNI